MEENQVASSRESIQHKVGEAIYFCLKQHKPSSKLVYQHNLRHRILLLQNPPKGFVPEPNPQSLQRRVASLSRFGLGLVFMVAALGRGKRPGGCCQACLRVEMLFRAAYMKRRELVHQEGIFAL